ncbi:MAG: potassium transporter TrkG, partial [Arthrobacter sp.]
ALAADAAGKVDAETWESVTGLLKDVGGLCDAQGPLLYEFVREGRESRPDMRSDDPVAAMVYDGVSAETISAFGTVGLSSGVSAALPVAGELILVVLMFTGRLGPILLASALALQERRLRYKLPEERPIIG